MDAEPVEPSLKPRMKPREAECFTRYAANARTYLEWGCGGSTVAAALAGAQIMDSVETDLQWIEACKAAPELAPMVAAGTLRFHHVDVGDVADWGKPANRNAETSWPNYYLGVWETIERAPNVVLVDGRWRVACALQALLHCDNDATILFHDFWRRPQYYDILEFVDTIDRTGTLAVFRRKPDIDWRLLGIAVGKFTLDYR